MKTHKLGSTLSVTASFLTLTLSLTGCPFGDCWGTADITVSVDKGLSPPSRVQVRVVEVTRILKSDVTGTTPEGLPIGPAVENRRILEVTFDPATGTGQAHDGMTDPYPTWYYAFVDLDDNGRLDSGEPFGTDPRNPSSSSGGPTCKSEHYQGSITINRRLP
ncbi:MAG TPA: hypothetical protein VFH73_21475 [Polyangia bacterium]|jgi:hypothetical protein|nr:hypothetical protein [Polyangia bacterium]